MRSFVLLFCVVIAFAARSFAQESADLVASHLLESTLRGDFDAIRAALDNGESIDVVNDKGWSAARFAVAAGDIGTLRFLIENRVDLNNADNEGVTPLMAAAQEGDREAVETLLANNASPLQKNAAGEDAWDTSRRANRQVISSLIAESATIHALNAEDLESVRESIRRGSFVNIRNAAGWTPLILATARGDLEAVKEILAHGADANRTENDGWTSLHFAADSGFDKIVDALLENDADRTIRNVAGKSAYDLAMDNNFLTIADKTAFDSEL